MAFSKVLRDFGRLRGEFTAGRRHVRTVAKEATRRLLAKADISLERKSRATSSRRVRFLLQENIDVVFDVGAHIGEYGRSLRREGYRGRIESFEPNPEVFARLEQRCREDDQWTAHPIAIGSTTERRTLHVAGNDVSSSLLDMEERHAEGAPGSAVVGDVEVYAKRLDDLDLLRTGEQVLLKIDTQGYEDQVLNGAEALLNQVRLVELELSVVPLYQGQMLLPELLDLMTELAFQLIWVERGFQDHRTGRMLQMDGIFVRADERDGVA